MLSLLLVSVVLAGDGLPLDVGIPLTVSPSGQLYQDELPVERTGALIVSLVLEEDEAWLRALEGVADVRRLGGLWPVYKVQVRAGHDELDLSASLQGDPRLRYAHPDLAVELVPASYEPDDPFYGDQWHLNNVGQASESSWPGSDINVLPAWDITRGAGQIIAVLDSGVDTSHPDLDIVPGFTPNPIGDENPDIAYSGYAHGTACAGLAAGTGDNGIGVVGVAPEAQIMGIRLLDSIQAYSDIYDSILYAVDNGATVLSNSWSLGSCQSYTLPEVVLDGLYYAEEVGRDGYGSAWVMAMGNDTCDNSLDGFQRVSSTVSVGALTDQDKVADYSSYGRTLNLVAASSESGRPGMLTTDIVGSTGYGSYGGDDSYTGSFSGTSAATPVVAGGMALMFAANPRLDIWTAIDVLCDTAVRVRPEEAGYDTKGHSDLYGCGRFDVGAAVAAVANGAPSAPRALLPEGELYLDQATLRWQAATDPDGESLRYEVSMWPADNPDGAWSITELSESALDLRPDVVVDQSYGAKVRAVDAWGPGPWSAAVSFSVVPTPEQGPVHSEVAGCAALGLKAGPQGAVFGLLALGLLALRRRS